MESKFTIPLILFLNFHTIHTINTIEVKTFLDTNENTICENSGVRCHDCWTSLNCIDLGNGTLHPELQHCPIGRSCIYETGFCESKGNYECSNMNKLKCNTEGTFPSPFNRIEYFTCVKGSKGMLQKFVSKCSPSYEFDPAKKLCRKIMVDDKRYLSSVSICQFENQIGSLRNNSNIFYRCEKVSVDVGFNLVPQLYGCAFDYQFNGTICVNPHDDFLDKNGMCLKNGMFANPNDCSQYYNCYVGQSPSIQGCSSYQKFDQMQGQCVYFDCNNCRV